MSQSSPRELVLPSDKFIPLFEPTRLPLIDTGIGKFDPYTRQVIDQDGIPVPPHRILDPGHLRTRYYVFYGGRGGAKSYQFAIAAIMRAVREKVLILCCREVQSSMADSVHRLLATQIRALGLGDHFEILSNTIRCSATGSEFAFRGLRHNSSEIKSFEGANIVWVEEARDVSEDSWDDLLPTIRKEWSEIWISFNTGSREDPTYVRFVEGADEDVTLVKVGYQDNPLLSPALLKEAEKLKAKNFEKWEHIYDGKPRVVGEGAVFTVSMLEIVDSAPPVTQWVRGWDLAATAPKKPDDPIPFTAGVLMGRATDGRIVIADVLRFQGKPETVERQMKVTMANDSRAVKHSIPQDPGQAGKFQVAYFAKAFMGHTLHFSTESGDKVERAGPFASQVNVGNVVLVRGQWNQAYVKELDCFPRGLKDQVDASSRAFEQLQTSHPTGVGRVRGL